MISKLVVLDTNVLVSAALKSNSNPADLLVKILSKEVIVVTCPAIIQEYKDVLLRPKFKKWKFPPAWFEYFISNSLFIPYDPPGWPLLGPDKDDLIFLSLAYKEGATLVTGNLADYPTEIRKGTEVVTPAQYMVWSKS